MSTQYQLTEQPYAHTLCSGTCGQTIGRGERCYVRAHAAWHPACVPVDGNTELLHFRSFADPTTQRILDAR